MEIEEFERRHNEQVASRSQRDVFMIWIVLMFLAVIAAHFLLNVTTPNPTGYVISDSILLDDLSSLVGAIGIFLCAGLVGALAHYGITRKVK